MNDDEINHLLNCPDMMVQANWNVTRETQFVPTSTASGFDDEEDDEDENGGYRVYDNRRRDKMKTIKEEADEERKSDAGSDTGYFDS